MVLFNFKSVQFKNVACLIVVLELDPALVRYSSAKEKSVKFWKKHWRTGRASYNLNKYDSKSRIREFLVDEKQVKDRRHRFLFLSKNLEPPNVKSPSSNNSYKSFK